MTMNSDIRLAVSFRGHRKRKRLRLLLGPGSTDCLIDLWIGAAMNHPDGLLSGMDDTDLALEAGWEGEPETFVKAMLECGFLEKTDSGDYALHDWQDHQGYAIHAESRKQRARNAAAKRWEKRNTPGNAESMPQASASDAGSNAALMHSDAPSPDPIPLPSPTPTPDPVPDPSPVPLPAPATGMGVAEKASESEPTPPAFPVDSESRRLAALMRDTLKANHSTFDEPDLSEWAKELQALVATDARMRDTALVERVIRWACVEPFWKGVIISPQRLQRNFTKIRMKMESEQTARDSPAKRRVQANQAAAEEAKALLFGNSETSEASHD
jgi:hypothetical protein